jgi:hypothetical protein
VNFGSRSLPRSNSANFTVSFSVRFIGSSDNPPHAGPACPPPGLLTVKEVADRTGTGGTKRASVGGFPHTTVSRTRQRWCGDPRRCLCAGRELPKERTGGGSVPPWPTRAFSREASNPTVEVRGILRADKPEAASAPRADAQSGKAQLTSTRRDLSDYAAMSNIPAAIRTRNLRLRRLRHNSQTPPKSIVTTSRFYSFSTFLQGFGASLVPPDDRCLFRLRVTHSWTITPCSVLCISSFVLRTRFRIARNHLCPSEKGSCGLRPTQ